MEYVNIFSRCEILELNSLFQTGLPLKFIHEVPVFTSKKAEEIEALKKILEEDENNHKVPLLFLSGAGGCFV